jgi:hypothetical protein
MADSNSLRLLQRVYGRTMRRTLEWRETNEERVFISNVGAYQVRIREIYDPEYPEQPDYALDIIRADGTWIESITNRDLRAFFDEKFEGRNPYQLLQETHQMAHKVALGVDEAIAELLAELED